MQAPFSNFPHPDNFGRILGYEVKTFDREQREAKVRLPTRDDHVSPSGKIHGGVISALLDYSCGVATCTTLGDDELCSTVEIKVNYFRPVNLGDELEATARVVFRGKKLCGLTALLHRSGDPEPVAMASATFNIIRVAEPTKGGGTA